MYWKNPWYLFNKVDNVKSWYYENNYNRWLISQNAPSYMFDRVLNIGVLWICLSGSEYARLLSIALVLNIQTFWIYEGSEYVRVTQVSEYTSIVPEYT